MKKLYFSIFFVSKFILTICSKEASLEVTTKLNLVNPTGVSVKKILSSNKTIDFNLSNLKKEEVKVYIKESENSKVDISFDKNSAHGKVSLNTKNNSLKDKVTLRVVYN